MAGLRGGAPRRPGGGGPSPPRPPAAPGTRKSSDEYAHRRQPAHPRCHRPILTLAVATPEPASRLLDEPAYESERGLADLPPARRSPDQLSSRRSAGRLTRAHRSQFSQRWQQLLLREVEELRLRAGPDLHQG